MKNSRPAIKAFLTGSTSPRVRTAAAFLGLLILLGAAYGWHTLQITCDPAAVQEAAARLIRQRDRYDHSYQFATSASRTAIVRPVAELQQILMDTQDVSVPACLQGARQELVSYMGTVIHAFVAYGANADDGAVRDLLVRSQAHYDAFMEELKATRSCAPLCLP